MATSSDFVRAWQEWLRVETPIENSRQRRFEAPTYKVEVALDHLDSSLYSLGLAVIDGRDLDFAERTEEELSELDRFSHQVETLVLNTREKKRFCASIAADRTLLMEISKLASTPDGESK
jgi:hypothetical protein